MDPLSYITPARVRVLLVPIGDITEKQFRSYVKKLRLAFEVRLVDVTPTLNKVFNPQAFPNGRVIYDFNLSLGDQESIFLHDFEPFRKTFIVIGLTNDPNVNYENLAQLSKHYKSSILHSVIVFDNPDVESDNDHIFVHTDRNIETIMCDITKLFLEDLSSYMASYQHITLRSPSSIGAPNDNKKINNQKKRISSGSIISLSLSDPSNNKISMSSANERRQSRIKGRQSKILGNLLLLAGQYTEALKELNDSVTLLNSSKDYLWLGSALEAITVCLVMLAYINNSYSFPSSLNFLVIGSNGNTVKNTPPPATPAGSPRPSTNNIVSSDQLMKICDLPELIYKITNKLIHYYELSYNDSEDCVPNLVYCESILRFLKFSTAIQLSGGFNHFAEDNIIKNIPLQSTKVQNFIENKEELFHFSKKIFKIQLRNMNILSQAKIYSSLSSIYGDMGLQRKRSFVIRALLVTLTSELVSNNVHRGYELHSLLNLILESYGVNKAAESFIEDLHSSNWSQLNKSIVLLSTMICERVCDFNNAVVLKSLLLTRYLNTLTDNEQIKILNEIKSISKNNDVAVHHFDPYLVRDIEVLKPNNAPKKQNKEDPKINKKDPFIYNPFAVVDKTSAAEVYLVQDEYVEFQISLQNPYAFQLNINSIEIPDFEVFKNHFIIPPKSNITITLLTKPLNHGKIDINQIKVKVFNFVAQNFKIARVQKSENFTKLKNGAKAKGDVLTVYRKNLTNNDISERVITKSLSLNITPPQPNLQLLSPPEQVILLEGGHKTISLKLKNNSSEPLSYIKFSIWDSTIEALKKVLNDKDLPVSEVYEIEYFILKKSLRILNPIDRLDPHEEIDLDLDISGKRGMERIKVFIDYGSKIVGDEIFIRTLEVPIAAVVSPSIELASCDIIPLTQKIDATENPIWEYLSKSGVSIDEYVLFLVDLRNTWNKFLTVEIEYESYAIKESILPLETKRILIPMKRIDISEEELLRGIPKLTKKQYILPKISKAEDDFQREAFWYREKILESLKGIWSFENTSISGNVEFRGIRLSQRMQSILRVDKVTIDISLKDIEFQLRGTYYKIKKDQFLTIKVQIMNNTTRDLKGVLRNIPLSSNYNSLDGRLLFNGALQVIVQEKIKPSEVYEFEIGVVILEKGEYEWGAVFEDLLSENQFIAKSPLKIKAV
ncbi:hypothetical protein WICMUC_004227 [Wickerhamomyces mucosus]|uniref:Uncharacterized protein n=1 Tax=Wickerhamomyces mucosus TaxID=1378264 RepID=A0A9P8TAX9_9ASCO|nr:hypothetical protein WICMUC_004227 [Wickerhamomyces mucosus]